MATISTLATALIVCVVVFITVTAIILTRSKAKIKTLEVQLINRVERSTHMESTYEDVTVHLSSVSAINTQDNVAYGHKQ